MILALALALAMAISLTGCGEPPGPGERRERLLAPEQPRQSYETRTFDDWLEQTETDAETEANAEAAIESGALAINEPDPFSSKPAFSIEERLTVRAPRPATESEESVLESPSLLPDAQPKPIPPRWRAEDVWPRFPRPAEPSRNDEKTPTEQRQPQTNPGGVGGSMLTGGRMLTPPADERQTEILPPGRFLRARLLGQVLASNARPLVFAELRDDRGRSIGTAIGRAEIQPLDPSRARIRFDQIRLDDGRVLKGAFEAFDRDFGLGLVGEVQRRPWRLLAQSAAEAALAVGALQNAGGNGLGDALRVNLADNLIQKARRQLDRRELERAVRLERGLTFWLGSAGEARATHPTAQHLDRVGEEVRDAFQTNARAGANADHGLLRLYQNLTRDLDPTSGGRP
jgi:hypothetical protein